MLCEARLSVVGGEGGGLLRSQGPGCVTVLMVQVRVGPVSRKY